MRLYGQLPGRTVFDQQIDWINELREEYGVKFYPPFDEGMEQ
jgi:hypothetical protein